MTFAACGGSEPDAVPSESPFPTANPTATPSPPVVDEVDYSTYQSYWMAQFDYKTMPVVGFVAPPSDKSAGGNYSRSFITAEDYRTVSESGINTVIGLYEMYPTFGDEVKQSLQYAEQAGISYIAAVNNLHTITNGPVLYNTLKPFLDGAYPALGGFKVYDEPQRPMFEKMSTVKGLIDQLIPDTLCYSNLFPCTGDKYTYYGDRWHADGIETYNYDDYLRDYMAIYQPQVLSYDMYPLHRGGTVDQWYFSNLSVIRQAAAKAGVPFWTYIQLCSFNSISKLPNEGEVNWLVSTSLALGAKGIQYFTYFLPKSNEFEQFTGSMIDENGNRTAQYDIVKKINAQIAAADEVLMQSISRGIMLSGSTPAPIPQDIVLTKYGSLEGVQAKHTVTGCFDFNGKAAYYLCNNSYTESDTAVLHFSGNAAGYSVAGGLKTAFSGGSLTLSLATGEGVLVVVE